MHRFSHVLFIAFGIVCSLPAIAAAIALTQTPARATQAQAADTAVATPRSPMMPRIQTLVSVPSTTPTPVAPASVTPDAATPTPAAPASATPDAATPTPATLTPSPMAEPTATISPSATVSPGAAPNVTYRYTFPVRAQKIQYGAYHHDYPATDIFCPVGSEFLAPIDGVVDFVSTVDRWTPATDRPEHRGGLAVAIIGDDGWRYYGSHLSAVAEGIQPGVRVSSGQRLGLTGASGDARSTPPHLHFGISHPTTPEDWQVRRGEIPPYPYLKAWQEGRMVTPQP